RRSAIFLSASDRYIAVPSVPWSLRQTPTCVLLGDSHVRTNPKDEVVPCLCISSSLCLLRTRHAPSPSLRRNSWPAGLGQAMHSRERVLPLRTPMFASHTAIIN